MYEVVRFQGGPLDGHTRAVRKDRQVLETDFSRGPFGYDGGVIASTKVTYRREPGSSTFILIG